MPTRRSREPKTSKRWNHARLSVEVRGKALELCTSGGVEGQRKIHKDAEDLMCSSRNEFFSRVMGVLAGNECFWTVLEDIKFVRMLPCVCRGVNDVMSVKANALPYWGVWTHCLRDHRWDEINTIMGVRKNYLPLLRDVSQEVPPTPPHRRVMRVYSLRGVMEKMIEMHGGYEGYAKRIHDYRRNRCVQINRRITFARKQAGIFGVSGLANGMKGVGRRARETSEKRRARILMEDQGLKEEFGRAVCGDGGMSPHAFVDPTWVVVDGDDTAGVWNVMCSAFDRSNEVKRSMASAALGVCLEMHMPSVLGMLSSRAESGKDVIPLEWRRSAVRAHALSLCRSLHVWFGGCEAMDSAVRYLSWFGDMDDPCTVEAALSDRDRYVDLMRSTTVKGSSGEEGQAISWPDGCPMKRVGGMVELARMP